SQDHETQAGTSRAQAQRAKSQTLQPAIVQAAQASQSSPGLPAAPAAKSENPEKSSRWSRSSKSAAPKAINSDLTMPVTHRSAQTVWQQLMRWPPDQRSI